MRKLVAYPLAYLFYYLGDRLSRIENRFNLNLYNAYNWCMCTSVSLQDWAELEEPWEEPYSNEKEVISKLNKLKRKCDYYSILFQHDPITGIFLVKISRQNKILRLKEYDSCRDLVDLPDNVIFLLHNSLKDFNPKKATITVVKKPN